MFTGRFIYETPWVQSFQKLLEPNLESYNKNNCTQHMINLILKLKFNCLLWCYSPIWILASSTSHLQSGPISVLPSFLYLPASILSNHISWPLPLFHYQLGFPITISLSISFSWKQTCPTHLICHRFVSRGYWWLSINHIELMVKGLYNWLFSCTVPRTLPSFSSLLTLFSFILDIDQAPKNNLMGVTWLL